MTTMNSAPVSRLQQFANSIASYSIKLLVTALVAILSTMASAADRTGDVSVFVDCHGRTGESSWVILVLLAKLITINIVVFLQRVTAYGVIVQIVLLKKKQIPLFNLFHLLINPN